MALASPERVDWVDYADRNRAADPAAFAADVVERSGRGGAVWLVASGGYRTLEGQCERLTAELARRRPAPSQPGAEDPAVFEHAALYRFPPAG